MGKPMKQMTQGACVRLSLLFLFVTQFSLSHGQAVTAPSRREPLSPVSVFPYSPSLFLFIGYPLFNHATIAWFSLFTKKRYATQVAYRFYYSITFSKKISCRRSLFHTAKAVFLQFSTQIDFIVGCAYETGLSGLLLMPYYLFMLQSLR